MSLDTVKLIFANRYDVSADNLTAESLISDVCTDSLGLLELLMYIEGEFSVAVPDEVAQEFKTLGDIAAFMEGNIPEEKIAEIRNKLL